MTPLLHRLLRRRVRPPQEPSMATSADERMMKRALELARRAGERGETPVGAVVYRTNTEEIVAEAHNVRESPPDPCGHAELLALRAAAKEMGDWRLNDCTLVVTLEPCAMCAGAIVLARVGRLVFGASDPKAGAVHSLYAICSDPRLNHRLEPIGGVLAEESSQMLKDFFRARRRSR